MTRSVRVVVYHGSYGCDTGCCGHYVELAERLSFEQRGRHGDEDGLYQWTFDHPSSRRDDFRAWALEFAQRAVAARYGPDHVADLDWDNCIVVDD